MSTPPEEAPAESGETSPCYAEQLRPPWWMWLLLLVMALSVGLVSLVLFAPLGVALAILTTFAAGSVLLLMWTGRVEVSGAHLRAGRARIPVTLLGPAVPLDAERARLLRGRDIDPSAYHYIRGWVEPAVMAEVTDPADPTPYWYVSSRRPARLAAAIDAARAAAEASR